jgi:2-polyprenyl-6-methoxyphenol hydroxylase-like FAD-dependent oxidoreductase
MAMLAHAGLEGLLPQLGAVRLSGLELATDRRMACLHHPLGVAVSRSAFDAALAESAVEAGASFLPATTVSLLPEVEAKAPFRMLRLSQDDRSWMIRGRFVVSATGLQDSLLGREGRGYVPSWSKLGAGAVVDEAPTGFAPGRIYMACGAEGYVGAVVLEDGRLDLAAALKPEAVREAGGIGPLAERILAKVGLPEIPGAAQLRWSGTPLLSRSQGLPSAGRVFRVGDSAGYVEPFTGEGIAWAIAGGRALAAILAESLCRSGRPGGGDFDPVGAWNKAYRREIGRRQVVCRAARYALRTPWLTRAVVRVLDAWPGLASPLLAAMHRAT